VLDNVCQGKEFTVNSAPKGKNQVGPWITFSNWYPSGNSGWTQMQFPDRKEGIIDSAYWPIPSGDAFAVQPEELVVVLARNFCPQKLTAKADKIKRLRGGILTYVAQVITQIDTARADNPASPDWTARAARQGEAMGRIKSTLSGWKPTEWRVADGRLHLRRRICTRNRWIAGWYGRIRAS